VIFTGNGQFVRHLQDLAGNDGYVTGTVACIDKDAPIIISSSREREVLACVITPPSCAAENLVLTGNEPYRIIDIVPQINGPEIPTSGEYLTAHTLFFASNWTGVLIIQDQLGNTGQYDINLTWIDSSVVSG
jgi:hypothetical protein